MSAADIVARVQRLDQLSRELAKEIQLVRPGHPSALVIGQRYRPSRL
jgi:hypothetical protein